MTEDPGSSHARILARVGLVLGAVLFALGLLFDARLVGRIHFRGWATSEALEQAARTRASFCVLGSTLCTLGVLVLRGRCPTWLRGRGATRLGLVLLAGPLPLFVLDRAARPFVERLTSIFLPDRALGWKHRPGADDTYWGMRVRINSRGMRGAERAPSKPAGVRRVLVLGDSVVFGLCLEDDRDTLPARLEMELETRTDRAVECLDAAVCGWSPWQHLRFLTTQGDLWEPDLVVLGFVLNDVTERFELQAFGGTTAGAQLAYTRGGGWNAWLGESGLYLALHELHLSRAQRARAATLPPKLTPYHLLLEPDSERVRKAWAQVLPELEAIQAWCGKRAVPVLLVVFPYALQLTSPAADAPQRILADFARRRAFALLDLLPPLSGTLKTTGHAPQDLFLDGLHLTALGSARAAEEIARFVVEHALLR